MMKNCRKARAIAWQILLAAVFAAASMGGAASRATAAEPSPAPRTALPDIWLAATDAPASKDALFGEPAPAAKDAAPGNATPASKDALFGNDLGMAPKSPWRGYVRGELARTYASPSHWSKMLVSSELDAEGAISSNVKYHLGARFDYDFVYDANDFYPPDVKRDQRANFLLRENYVDVGAGDWDYRFGRQQIVWGEMVGLFFADVVSAKDLREFILPDFDQIRIPQWAARAEYFKGDFHLEAIWIPVVSYDDIGKPGAEFFPALVAPPPGFATRYDNEQFPNRSLAHTNAGLRLSYLKNGWDMSGFYYGSMDAQPTFYRMVVDGPTPAYLYQARHDRIDQLGGTLSKDLGFAVLKAETVYTRGRSFESLDPASANGVVRQNTLDVIGGLDFTLPADTRLNVQLFNRTFFDHDPTIPYKANEPGATLLVNHKFGDNVEAEVLWVTSLVRNDWMLRPHVTWRFKRDWQWRFGVDVFDGPPLGLFGQYNDRDRVYSEVRYSF